MSPLPADHLLRISQIAMTYRAKPALRNVSWSLRRGEQWALLGPNGAGKTTLAGIISGQNSHFSGELQRGADLIERGVAYVCFEQAKALVDRDRKLDVSEFSADATDAGTRVHDLLPRPPEEPETALWIERLAIAHILDRGLRFLSTGEMRKALLLSALLRKPGLMILDSPLDGLDAASQQVLAEAIGELMAGGQPVLVLARQIIDVPAACSHVLVLDGGEIHAAGPRTEVLDFS